MSAAGAGSDVIWAPDPAAAARTNVARYMRWLASERDLRFEDYLTLWRWSIGDPDAFWRSLWSFGAVSGAPAPDVVLAQERMPGARWCPGVQINYAEQILRPRELDQSARPAIIGLSESAPAREIAIEQVRAQAGALAQTLRAAGVVSGDRVVAYLPNIPEAVIALLACASIGAVWSVCAPDFGTDGVLARFSQLAPKVLIAVDGYRFGGRAYDRRADVAALRAGLPTVTHTIWVENLGSGAPPAPPAGATAWERAIAPAAELRFEPVPFEHPLWVLFSSGTTGAPKGIVHGHGGIVLEHYKSLGLGMDLGADDRLLLLGSTSWMVWNLIASSLMHGTTAVVLDGNPLHPDLSRLWETVAEHRVSALGVGASLVHAWAKAGLTLVVGVEHGEDYYMPLFVVLEPGVDPDRARTAIVAAIRRALSPRHVPDEIVVAPGIPHTRTGKKLEVPVKRMLQGAGADEVLDSSAVDDPSLISFYARFAQRHTREQERAAHV
jgi:acetoacetyl-CoA synthetase